jgi:hypothetical protein
MKHLVLPPRNKRSKEDDKKARGLRAGAFLWSLVEAEKKRMDPASWIASGGMEAEAALQAWNIGGGHGFFSVWKERIGTVGANRPAPADDEIAARRAIIRLCEALRRTGLGPDAARRLAAKALANDSTFVTPPSRAAIKHWEDRQSPLGPEDEAAISTAIQRCSSDHKLLVSHFIGLARAVHNPAARIL